MTAFDWGLLEPLGSAAEAASDDAVLTALVDVEQALVRAWAGVDDSLTPDAAAAVAESLHAERLDRGGLLAGARAGGVPVIPLVTQLRSQAESARPGSGELVHRGATSQDILDTAIVLVAARSAAQTRFRLVSAGRALFGLAVLERSTPTIARTLGQHAASSTVGASVAVWLDAVSSAIEALDSTAFPAQLGGAVGTGQAFAEVSRRPEAVSELRSRLAAELGLADPGRAWHTERSAVERIAAANAAVATAIARIGRDVTFLARTEIGEVELASTGGSSAMPHKRNPVDAVLITAGGLRAPGLLATVYSAAVSADARPAGEWHAEWQAIRGLLRIALESSDALASLAEGIRFDRDAVARNASLSPDLQRDGAGALTPASIVVGAALDRFTALTTGPAA